MTIAERRAKPGPDRAMKEHLQNLDRTTKRYTSSPTQLHPVWEDTSFEVSVSVLEHWSDQSFNSDRRAFFADRRRQPAAPFLWTLFCRCSSSFSLRGRFVRHRRF